MIGNGKDGRRTGRRPGQLAETAARACGDDQPATTQGHDGSLARDSGDQTGRTCLVSAEAAARTFQIGPLPAPPPHPASGYVAAVGRALRPHQRTTPAVSAATFATSTALAHQRPTAGGDRRHQQGRAQQTTLFRAALPSWPGSTPSAARKNRSCRRRSSAGFREATAARGEEGRGWGSGRETGAVDWSVWSWRD